MRGNRNRRVIGVYSGTALVISTMIGTGIFTTTGLMVEMGARSGDILLAWLLGGLLALCGALCYGELGANMPESGAEYYYISRVLHPSLGFLSGWVSLIVGFSAPIAAASMAMHIYVAQVFSDWPVRLMAVVTILIFSVLHAYDLRLGARVQMALALLKIILIISFIAGVFITGPRPQIEVVTAITPDFWFTSSYAVILVFIAFAYAGWNAAAYIGAEIINAGKNLPRALLLGTLTVTALYILVNFAYLSAVPTEHLAGVESVANTVSIALWGTTGGTLISLLIAFGLVSTVSAMIIAGPRVSEAMAKDSLFPRALAQLNQHGVPSLAVFLQALIATVIALTATFGALLIYIGFTLNIFAALAVFTVFRTRKKGISSIRVCRGYPLTPLVFLIFTIWMTVWSIKSQPLSTLSGLGTLVIGYLIYLVYTYRMKKGSA
ncbi:MAG: amino acid permease [Thermodesulfovibrionia bacterium]|nr:amino acid permease [Thermodesulfovibrionia bacterium]